MAVICKSSPSQSAPEALVPRTFAQVLSEDNEHLFVHIVFASRSGHTEHALRIAETRCSPHKTCATDHI